MPPEFAAQMRYVVRDPSKLKMSSRWFFSGLSRAELFQLYSHDYVCYVLAVPSPLMPECFDGIVICPGCYQIKAGVIGPSARKVVTDTHEIVEVLRNVSGFVEIGDPPRRYQKKDLVEEFPLGVIAAYMRADCPYEYPLPAPKKMKF